VDLLLPVVGSMLDVKVQGTGVLAAGSRARGGRLGVLQHQLEGIAGHTPLGLALDGGADGLVFYDRICAAAPAFLAPGGALVLEHGFDQADAVRARLANLSGAELASGWSPDATFKVGTDSGCGCRVVGVSDSTGMHPYQWLAGLLLLVFVFRRMRQKSE